VNVSNPEDVHPVVRSEISPTTHRAFLAGANLPLEYLGAGATAIVYCDASGTAWKVYRNPEPAFFYAHEAEAEWLLKASSTLELAGNVPRNVRWHPDEQVLERDCIVGRPAGWSTRGVRELYERIKTVMRRHGWGAPEFKEDSFVVEDESGKLILVDAGFVHRYGENLLRYVREVLAGERRHPERVDDLMFALRISMHDGEIPLGEGERLHERLRLSLRR
jgi:hypothetical protein